MWERVVIHSDINHCYVQIEEMMFPELKKVPMVVGDNQKSHQGIVLAKNDLAKKYHIETGELLRDAYQKCPDLLVIEPHYDDYLYYIEEIKNIYREYTDQVESFGLDEVWIDLTSSQMLFGGDPIETAKEIQERVYQELGITVSMGLSFNKTFAKLGSDLNKQKGLTVISRKNFKNIIYPLQVRDFPYIDKAITAQLNERGIYSIGEIAVQRKDDLKSFLGKNGEMIWCFANGMDVSEMSLSSYEYEPKSVGNGMTAIHDISTYEEAKGVFRTLVESVSSRLKEQNLKGSVVSIHMHDHKLHSFTRQRKIDTATNISSEIMTTVEILLQENCLSYYNHLDKPYRSVSVCVSQLSHDADEVQLSFFADGNERQKEKRIDMIFSAIRQKFEFSKIKKYCMEFNRKMTGFSPKDKHIIRSEGWIK